MEMLFIQLDKSLEVPLYEQIYNQIQRDITEGKLPVGMKLPSKRQLGEFLSVSQTTIELAYGQLAAEGFISSKPRKGYFVQAIEELAYVQPAKLKYRPASKEQEKVSIDFSPGKIDTGSFPFTQWRKYARDIIDNSSEHLLLLGHPHGDIELRRKLPVICIIRAASNVRPIRSSSVLEPNSSCRSSFGFSGKTQLMPSKTPAIR